jgi:hypothetical protein
MQGSHPVALTNAAFGSDLFELRIFLVALPPVRDLLLFAEDLFVGARTGGAGGRARRLSRLRVLCPLRIFQFAIPGCLRIWPSIISRSVATLPAALTTIARASRGRSAASSSIALRKQAMARSAVRASSVGGTFLLPFE